MQKLQMICENLQFALYRDRLKSMQILLSRTLAGTSGAVKQEQEENSRNHVQAFQPISVQGGEGGRGTEFG